MAGVPLEEIAAVEKTTMGTVQARLSRARYVVTEGLADVLSDVLGLSPDERHEGDLYDDEGEYR